MQNSARSGDLGMMVIIAAILIAFALTPFAMSLPKVDSAPGPGEFDTQRAIARLARVLGDERAHPVDTAANDAVRARLLAEIEAMGYAPEVRDDFSCFTRPKWRRAFCARVRNIVFRAGPEAGDAVMLAAHYDSVPAGPGAADDGLGVAVELEIAKLFSQSPPARPVTFLLTDGEEMGLLGARSFVRKDPLADKIAAVVNVEARGDKGPAVMFQTSQPNSADLAAYRKGTRRPFSNSMMTDIYRLLPNDTDVTEFLPKGYDALNMALVEGLSHYHTPRDNLAALDPRSVQHAGREALGAVKAFLGEKRGGESQVIFADLLSRWLIVMPQWAGGAVLLFGLAAGAFSFFRAGGPRPLRALLAPPALLAFAAGACWLAQTIIAGLRREALYWYAHPQAIVFVGYFCAALATALAFGLLARGARRERAGAASWFWFAAAGAGLWFVAPGSSILFAPALLVWGIGVLIGFQSGAAKTAFAGAAALLALLFVAPALYMAGVTLGGGSAAVFALGAGLIMMVAAPLAFGDEMRARAAPALAAAAGLAAAFCAALWLPAYSTADPAPLNINYVVDADAKSAQWVITGPRGEPPPKAVAALAPFAFADIPGFGRWPAAPADYVEAPAPEIALLSDRIVDGTRQARIRIAAHGADWIGLRIPESAKAVSFRAGDETIPFGAAGAQRIDCAGRACDGAEFTVTMKATSPQDWMVSGIRFGLPPSAAPLLKARPAAATPVQFGDTTIVRARERV